MTFSCHCHDCGKFCDSIIAIGFYNCILIIINSFNSFLVRRSAHTTSPPQSPGYQQEGIDQSDYTILFSADFLSLAH